MLSLLFESPLTVALTLITGLVGLVYWWCVSTYDYWKNKGVPYEPPTAFFGNLKDTLLMRRSINEVHQDIYRKFEGHRFVGIYHARQPTLFVRDPELVKSILVRDFQHFQDRGTLIHEKNPLQQHLFNLPGKRWRVLRNKMTPTFTSGRMKSMFPVIEECSRRLNSYLSESADRKEIIEIKEVLAKFSTDVIGTCAFGLQMNALDDPKSEFRNMGRKVFESSTWNKFALFTNTFMPEVGSILKLDDLGGGVTDFFMRVVKETTEYRLKNNVSRNDFLQLLINLRYKGSIDDSEEAETKPINGVNEKSKEALDFEFDDGLMAAQAFVFFLAGFETSSTTVSFALHELIQNPDIQTKLREEIDASLEETGGKFTYDSVMNLKYLDKVVSEALRIHTAVPFLMREVSIPYTVPGTQLVLEKGRLVAIPSYSIMRDPKHYPDPERFDPERFSEEEKAKRHHYTYLPFGEGPRNCIGMRFGLLQSKLGLAALISKYEFHLCERTELPMRLDPKTVVTSTTTGIYVRITHRT